MLDLVKSIVLETLLKEGLCFDKYHFDKQCTVTGTLFVREFWDKLVHSMLNK